MMSLAEASVKGGLGGSIEGGSLIPQVVADRVLQQTTERKMSSFETKYAEAAAALEAKKFTEAISLAEQARSIEGLTSGEKRKCSVLIKSANVAIESAQNPTASEKKVSASEVITEHDVKALVALERSFVFFAQAKRALKKSRGAYSEWRKNLGEKSAEFRYLTAVLKSFQFDWDSDVSTVKDERNRLWDRINADEHGRNLFGKTVKSLSDQGKIHPDLVDFIERKTGQIFSQRKRETNREEHADQYARIAQLGLSIQAYSEIDQELQQILASLKDAKTLQEAQEILKKLPNAGTDEAQMFILSRKPGCMTYRAYIEKPNGVSDEMIFKLHEYSSEAISDEDLVLLDEMFGKVTDESLRFLAVECRCAGARNLMVSRRHKKAAEKKAAGATQAETSDTGDKPADTENETSSTEGSTDTAPQS